MLATRLRATVQAFRKNRVQSSAFQGFKVMYAWEFRMLNDG